MTEENANYFQLFQNFAELIDRNSGKPNESAQRTGFNRFLRVNWNGQIIFVSRLFQNMVRAFDAGDLETEFLEGGNDLHAGQ
jgi:hypothetical protein